MGRTVASRIPVTSDESFQQTQISTQYLDPDIVGFVAVRFPQRQVRWRRSDETGRSIGGGASVTAGQDHGSRGTRPVLAYLGGMGRSGSTLLTRVLGRLPDAVSVGEQPPLWSVGIRNNQLCG